MGMNLHADDRSVLIAQSTNATIAQCPTFTNEDHLAFNGRTGFEVRLQSTPLDFRFIELKQQMDCFALGPVVITFIAFLAVLAIPVIIFAFIVKVFVLVFRA
jgi:hypothetical protein